MLAGGVIFLLTWPFRDAFVLMPVVVGILVYLIMAYVLKLVSREDMELARKVGRNGWLRLSELVSTASTFSQ